MTKKILRMKIRTVGTKRDFNQKINCIEKYNVVEVEEEQIVLQPCLVC